MLYKLTFLCNDIFFVLKYTVSVYIFPNDPLNLKIKINFDFVLLVCLNQSASLDKTFCFRHECNMIWLLFIGFVLMTFTPPSEWHTRWLFDLTDRWNDSDYYLNSKNLCCLFNSPIGSNVLLCNHWHSLLLAMVPVILYWYGRVAEQKCCCKWNICFLLPKYLVKKS